MVGLPVDGDGSRPSGNDTGDGDAGRLSGGGNGIKPKAISDKARMEGKHELLHAKRWHLVHAELIKALDASSHGDCTQDIDDLVAVFGLPFENKPDWNRRKDWFAVFDARSKAGFPMTDCKAFKTRLEAIWHALKITLKKQIDTGRLVTDITKCLGDMNRVAALISFQIGARKFAADLTVNAPKAWGPVDPHTLVPVPKAVVPRVAKAPKQANRLSEIDRLTAPADIDWNPTREATPKKKSLSTTDRSKIFTQLKKKKANA